jgi:dihydrofolate reductase
VAGDQSAGGSVIPPLAIVVAVARNGVIGGDNRLLWKLRSDMHHFRAITMGKPMIMGRRTWDSIGRPLPGRESIIVTRDQTFQAEGAHVVHDIAAALKLAQDRAKAMNAAEIVLAGGGDLYAQMLDQCDVLHVTEVDLAPEGDAIFPTIDPAQWREVSREAHEAGQGDEAAYAFVTYMRR